MFKEYTEYRKDKEIDHFFIDTTEDVFIISPEKMEQNEKTTDNMFVGNHDICWGLITIRDLGRYKAICCTQCGLRIKVPSDIKTAEDLKKYFEDNPIGFNG